MRGSIKQSENIYDENIQFHTLQVLIIFSDCSTWHIGYLLGFFIYFSTILSSIYVHYQSAKQTENEGNIFELT